MYLLIDTSMPIASGNSRVTFSSTESFKRPGLGMIAGLAWTAITWMGRLGSEPAEDKKTPP